MLPIVTPEEMAAIDAAAPVRTEVLIERAGAAVSWAALRMLGGAYGRTVNVMCGTGQQRRRRPRRRPSPGRQGCTGRVFEVPSCPPVLPPSDLVIDAAYGTGFHGTWSPPDVGDTPVLAVDVPSGVDALTGDIAGEVLAAAHTVTFAALKPGLLMPPGSALAGELELADIGLDVGWARANLVQAADVVGWWPERDEYAHKWRSAVRVIAGSSTMTGATVGCARSDALRCRHGASVDPRHDAGRGSHRNRPATAAQHIMGRCRAGVARPISCDRRRARAGTIRRHRCQHSQARRRGTAADGDRW